MRVLIVSLFVMAIVRGDLARAADTPVQWRDDAPVSYAVEDLRAPGGKVVLALHNTTKTEVPVTVSVQGPPELTKLFKPLSVPVPAGGDLDAGLTVEAVKNPKADSYTGTLVVQPTAGGALDRRPLTVVVAGAKAQPVVGAQLDPAGLPDVTLPATNFLPSPASEAGSTLLVVALVVIALMIVWRRWILGILALLLVVGGIALGAFSADQSGGRAIVAKSLEVSENANPGHAGVVLDGQGDAAELLVRKRVLSVEGLRHAGEHKGKLDLNGSAAEGSAAATVNVRDWWLWALLAIGIGVGVGLVVRKWFDRDRPRARLALRLDELFARVRDAPFDLPNWIPLKRVARRAAQIRRELDDQDTTADAEKAVTALAEYIDESEGLRNRVAELQAAMRLLEDRRHERDLVPCDQVVALRQGKRALNYPFDTLEPDTGKTLLTAAGTKVGDATTFVELVADRYAGVIACVAAAKRVEVRDQELEDAQAELLDHARAILCAATADDVEKSYTAAMAIKDDQDLEVKSASDLSPRWAVTGDALETLPATIEVEVTSAGYAADAKPNVDDGFQFRAIFAEPPAEPLDVIWTFGPGKTVKQRLLPEAAGPWVEWRFDAPGVYDVQLTDSAGKLLGQLNYTLEDQSRRVSLREALRERENKFIAIAMALTIASGMATLYIVDPAWGTNDDYVKALLWGAVVGEGVALVAAIIAQLYPAKA